MCHQEPLPASYAQAFACLWDLVSPQHTHEPCYAMTPHFTPLELEFIPYAGGAWGIPDGCSPRARHPACDACAGRGNTSPAKRRSCLRQNGCKSHAVQLIWNCITEHVW